MGITITCTQPNLLAALASVAPIAGRNSQLPILNYVLFQVEDNLLTLFATDLEVGVQASIGGKFEGEGVFTLPAREALVYIQQLPAQDPLTLTYKKGVVNVAAGRFKAEFNVGQADDFPLFPASDGATTLQLPGDVLVGALQQVVFSAARDESRPEIRSVYMAHIKGELRLAATDSFRLAERVIPGVESVEDFECIIPISSAQEVIRLFSREDDVEVHFSKTHIRFSSNVGELTTRLIDGSYPNYQQIIPQKTPITFKVETDEFLRALKTLTVFLPRDSRRVHITVDSSSERLIARVAGGGAGQGTVEVPISGAGADIEVLVNIQYLLEGVQRLGAAECSIGVTNESSPLLVQPVEVEDAPAFIYVVMPIQA